MSNPKNNKFYRENVSIQMKILEDITNKVSEKYYKPIATITLPKSGVIELYFNGSRCTYRGKMSSVKFDGKNYLEMGYFLEKRLSGFNPPQEIVVPGNALVSEVFKKKV